jgi:hypothetical protein
MATTVQLLGKQNLPGGGFDSSGVPKQNKRFVWGIITATAFTIAGEPLTPDDVGLSTIDAILFDVQSMADTPVVPSNEVNYHANYDRTNQKIIVTHSVVSTDAVTAEANEAAVIRFVAFGDSAEAGELL